MPIALTAERQPSGSHTLAADRSSLAGSILVIGSRIGQDLVGAMAATGRGVARLKRAPNKLEALAQDPPLCAVLDLHEPEARDFCEATRLSWALSDLAIIAVVDDPWSEEVEQACRAGAEDFAPRSQPAELARKIEALTHLQAPAVPRAPGQVVLADPDRLRRVRLGRQLRRLGLEVRFAVDGEIPEAPAPTIVVAHCQLPPSGAVPALERFHANADGHTPWILVGSRWDLECARAALPSDLCVELHDETLDPSQIIAVANGVLVAERTARRRSPRVPYATPVHLGQADVRCRWGMSWNLSADGLYVRTLDAPPIGTALELELQPPHGRGRAIVAGNVVWRQAYSGQRGYPPGFGFMLSPQAAVADRAALRAGYEALREDSLFGSSRN
jgi:CheY-like chemotaxis protein